jgi:phenylacetate-CoA ligase
MGTWCGYFGGRSVVPVSCDQAPFWRYNFPGRQIMFSAYHITRRYMAAYIDELRRRRPPWLHGYPSLLALVAFYLADTGHDLGYQVRWITTGAESLLPHQSDLIQRAFGVKPRQHYGMAEAAANFSECELGRLHVDEDFAAVEFLPAGDGVFRVVGTNFSNPATPLIRYEVQDYVTLAGNGCPCGRPGRIVASVDGRVEDYVVLPNGCRLGRLDHVFKDLVHITEAQIYQRSSGEITLRIVPGPQYSSSDEERLLSELRRRVGDKLRVRIDYVNAIERTASGKLRFVVTELSEARVHTPSI